MLSSPVVRFPLECDIGLLRQHYRLLGKGSSVRRVVRRKGTGGEQLWLGTFHAGRYTRFFRKRLCVSVRGDGLTEYLLTNSRKSNFATEPAVAGAEGLGPVAYIRHAVLP